MTDYCRFRAGGGGSLSSSRKRESDTDSSSGRPQERAIQWARDEARELDVYSIEVPWSNYAQSGKTCFEYEASTLDSFIQRYRTMNVHERHYYEIICGVPKRPDASYAGCHLYMDIEYGRTANPFLDGRAMMARILDALFDELEVGYADVDFRRESLLVLLDATTRDKFSQHVLLRVRDGAWAFRDIAAVQSVILRVQRRLLEEDMALDDIDASDTTCVFTSGRDVEQRISAIDHSVYSRHRAFRIVYSSKYGDPERRMMDAPPSLRHDELRRPLSQTLRLLDAGADQSVLSTINQFDEAFVRASLINNVRLDAELVDALPSPEVALVLRKSTGSVDSLPPPPRNDAPLRRSTSVPPRKNTVPALLVRMVESDEVLARSGIESMIYKPMRFSLKVQSQSTYCFTAGRNHRTNRTFFYINLRTGRIAPYCYSGKCQGLKRPKYELGERARALFEEFTRDDHNEGLRAGGDDAADAFHF